MKKRMIAICLILFVILGIANPTISSAKTIKKIGGNCMGTIVNPNDKVCGTCKNWGGANTRGRAGFGKIECSPMALGCGHKAVSKNASFRAEDGKNCRHWEKG